jgi:WD40 repeat protein
MPLDNGAPHLTLGPFGPVNSVSLAGSGASLAAGCHDHHARVWDTATGTELLAVRHPDNVYTVALSPDGSLLATGTGSGLVRVLDAGTGDELSQAQHRDNASVVALAVSPDGAAVGYGDSSGVLRVIEARTGSPLGTADQADEVTAVQFSPDGTKLVAASYTGTAVVLTLGPDPGAVEIRGMAGNPHRPARSPGPSLRAATFSPAGDLIAFGGHDAIETRRGSAHVATPAGELIASFPHADYVSSIAFCHGGRTLVTAAGTQLTAYDLESGLVSWRHSHEGMIWVVAASPDLTTLATACRDHTARLIDAATGGELARFEHDGPVTAVAFRPDSGEIATGSWDGYARLFAVP